MRRSSTRRTLLTTLGTATTLSLAGCSGLLGTPNNSKTPAASTQTPTSTATAGPETSTTTNGSPPTTGTPAQQDTPFSRGKLVEDFEGSLKRWRALAGKVTVDKQNPYQGSQSVVLRAGPNTNKSSTATTTTKSTNSTTTTTTGSTSTTNSAGMARSYYSSEKRSGGLDLRNHDLTMAVRFEQPVRGRIGVELIAPTTTLSLTSQRFLPKELNGWTRFDLGYTGTEGNPTLNKILGIRIIVNTDGAPINVAIDDIRTIPKPKKGKVMFQFDDGHSTTYTEAFSRLKQRNWPAGAAIIPQTIGTAKNMTWANLRKLANAGWDMMAHPPVANPLPTYSAKNRNA